MRLLCKFGLHSWWLDSAFFSSVRRCHYCDAVDDVRAARRLEYERAHPNRKPPWEPPRV